jgi:type II secretory pathway component PulF
MSGRLNGHEAADLSSQIAGLARAGLPLAQGLAALGEEMPRGRLRTSVKALATTLESGIPLEQALETHGSSIPPHLRGLVIAGMRSGDMGDLLGRFSEYVSIRAELTRKLWLSFAYPALTAGIALALLALICVGVVSRFEAIYKDFNIPLPRPTRALVVFSRMIESASVGLAIAAGALLCIWVAARLLLPRPLRRSLAGRLPLLGKVWRLMSLAEFCHLLALLVEGRLPLPEALRLTGEGVENADIDGACRVMAGQVESGRSLAQSMAERVMFPFGLPRLLRWAENQKSLPEVLHMAGLMFEARARSQSAFVGIILNFACVIIVLCMILAVPALFAPLINLLNRLAG